MENDGLVLPHTDMLFRADSMDIHTIAMVMYKNEYRLPKFFSAGDEIVDIGANIGAFALACLARGAGFVDCYEADPANIHYLRKNLSKYQGKHSVTRAVIYNDTREINFSSDKFATSCGKVVDNEFEGTKKYKTIPIDSILPDKPFRLLKMDIEGSEWPILYESKKLENAKQILVELHTSIQVKGYACTLQAMTEFLGSRRFAVESWAECPGVKCNYLLRATNRRLLS